MDKPYLVAHDYDMDSALWFFKRNNIWKICDEGVNDDALIDGLLKLLSRVGFGLRYGAQESRGHTIAPLDYVTADAGTPGARTHGCETR